MKNKVKLVYISTMWTNGDSFTYYISSINEYEELPRTFRSNNSVVPKSKYLSPILEKYNRMYPYFYTYAQEHEIEQAKQLLKTAMQNLLDERIQHYTTLQNNVI